MSDEPRDITDEMMLSELTVGEFKQLMSQILHQVPADMVIDDDDDETPAPKTLTRKSLDQFMSDLGNK